MVKSSFHHSSWGMVEGGVCTGERHRYLISDLTWVTLRLHLRGSETPIQNPRPDDIPAPLSSQPVAFRDRCQHISVAHCNLSRLSLHHHASPLLRLYVYCLVPWSCPSGPSELLSSLSELLSGLSKLWLSLLRVSSSLALIYLGMPSLQSATWGRGAGGHYTS